MKSFNLFITFLDFFVFLDFTTFFPKILYIAEMNQKLKEMKQVNLELKTSVSKNVKKIGCNGKLKEVRFQKQSKKKIRKKKQFKI